MSRNRAFAPLALGFWHRFYWLGFTALLSLPLPALAQKGENPDPLTVAQASTSSQDLWGVYLAARAIAPALVSARSQYLSDQQAIPQARSAFLPKVALTVQDGHDRADLEESRSTTYPSKGYTVSVHQSLFDARSWQELQEAALTVQRADVVFSAAQQMLMLQISENYFALLSAEDDLRLASNHTTVVQNQLDMARHRYEEGDVSIIDEQEAEAELERARSDQLAASNALEAQRAALKRRVGRETGPLATLPVNAPLLSLREDDEDYWVDQAKDHSTDVRQRELTRYIAQREVRKARAAFLPTVGVTLSHSGGNLNYLNDQVAINTSGNQNSFHQGSSNVAMLQISIPLFDGLSTVSAERAALAQDDKAQADFDDARLEAELRAKQIYLDLSNAFAQEQTLSRALAAGRLALESNRTGYDVGLRINTDVLRAEEVVYTTSRDLARSRYEIVLDHLRLRANAGELNEQDIQTISSLLAAS